MRKLPIIFFLILSLALVACGDDNTSTPSTTVTGTTTTPSPTATVTSGSPISNNTQTLPDLASVVERVAPAVVQVIATVEQRNAFGQAVESASQGSGVFFNEDGYILTNNHVVEGARQVQIARADRPRVEAEVIGTDPRTDLAVLRVEPDEIENYTWVPLGDTDSMRIGDWVIAIGSPLGFEGSVTQGIISAKNRSLPLDANLSLHDLVQTDAVINPGNSGGPLLNLNGEVIGINTAIIRGSIGNNQQAEGLGFAISMGTAKPVSDQLIENGRVIRPSLGVLIDDVTPVVAAELGLSVEEGVLVTEVVPGSPAERAGIEANDVIVQIDDIPITSTSQLVRLVTLGEYEVGDTVTVTIVRSGTTMTFDVTLEELSG